MPEYRIYLPQSVADRLEKAAASFCLSRQDLVRALLSAAAADLVRNQKGAVTTPHRDEAVSHG